MPPANIIREYGEHQNADNIDCYEYNPEDLIAFSLQITTQRQKL